MEFQLSYFKSWKMMLWKCCTQYASMFWKLSGGHRAGKGHFSFQILSKGMPEMHKLLLIAQLHSSHMLVKKCSKFSKPGFNNTWTMKFQMFKLVLEKAEEPEIKLPTSNGSSKKQESSKNHLFLLYWLCQNIDSVGHKKQWKILQEMGIPDHLTCLLRNLYASQEAVVDMEQQTGSNSWKE